MWGYVPGLFTFPHVVLAMNSGQVWLINRFWGWRSRKALGRSPGQGLGGLYRGKDAQRDTVFRGLSGASLPTETIYMHSPHWGRWATGGAGAISPQRATPAPTSASSQICTVCGLLFTGRRPKWPVQSPGWKKFRRGGSSHTQFLGPQLRVSRQRVVPTLWGVWPVQPSSCEAAVSSAHAPWYQPLASTQRGDQHEERLPPTLVSREATLELNKRSHSSGLGPPHPQLPKSQPPPCTLATKTSDGLSHTGALCFGTDHVPGCQRTRPLQGPLGAYLAPPS